jgi:hypothetical protein
MGVLKSIQMYAIAVVPCIIIETALQEDYNGSGIIIIEMQLGT